MNNTIYNHSVIYIGRYLLSSSSLTPAQSWTDFYQVAQGLICQSLKIIKNGEPEVFLSSAQDLISLLICSNICLPHVVEIVTIFSCCNGCVSLLALSLLVSSRRVALCCFYPPVTCLHAAVKPCGLPVLALIFPSLSAPLAAAP